MPRRAARSPVPVCRACRVVARAPCRAAMPAMPATSAMPAVPAIPAMPAMPASMRQRCRQRQARHSGTFRTSPRACGSLNCNSIDDAGVSMLGEALQVNRTLTMLECVSADPPGLRETDSVESHRVSRTSHRDVLCPIHASAHIPTPPHAKAPPIVSHPPGM